jgi:hypothetical protein
LPRRVGAASTTNRNGPKDMKRLLLSLILLILLAGVGGAVFLAFYPIPAPTQRMELPVPNEKLAN